jgi:hypothetical protein
LLVVTLASLLGAAVPGLDTPDSPYQLLNGVFVGVFFVSIPLSIGVAILRYRLWDIDSIINRALVYGLLTTLLGALYASLTIGLEGFALTITGTANQPVALIISTLVIAALSQPLRKRLQSFIDRRFYRKKYDAEKTLATFSATLREALDLEEIREQLIAVVQETMQPAQVSLWLRTPERPTGELLDHLDLRGWPPLFLKTGG